MHAEKCTEIRKYMYYNTTLTDDTGAVHNKLNVHVAMKHYMIFAQVHSVIHSDFEII